MAPRPIRITIVGDDQSGQAFDSADGNAQSFGGTMEKVGGLGSKALGAITVALGALTVGFESFADALDIEAANDKLAAQLGLTAEESRKAGEVAGSLYNQAYGESIAEVNDAIKSVGINIADLGTVSQPELEGITSRVLDLASAFDQDVNGVTIATGQLLKNGLAPDAETAFDIITAGFQNGADKGEDFLDTLNEYAQPLKSLGLDGATATGILSQGLLAGARNGDLVADALKEFAIRAKDGSATSAAGYAAIGLSASEMTAKIAKGGESAKQGLDQVLDGLRGIEDPVKRNAAAVALFGTQAEDLQGALFAIDPSSAVASLGQVEGAAADMSATLADNAKTKLESFKRSLTTSITNVIGGEVLPALEGFVTKIGPTFDLAKSAISQFAKGDAAGAGVDIAGIFGFGEDEQATRNIIGGLQFILDKFGEAKDYIAEIMPQVQEAIGHVLSVIKTLWEVFGDDLINNIKSVWDLVSGVIGGALDVIKGIVQVVLAVINGDWGKAWEGIQQIVGGAFEIIKSVVGFGIDFVKNVLGAAWDFIKFAVSNAWDNITGKISGAWNSIKTIISTGVGETIELAKSLPGKVLDAIGDFNSLLRDSGRKLMQGLIDGIKDKLGDVKQTAKDTVQAIKDFFPFSPAKTGPLSGSGDLSNSGKSMMKQIAGGINAELPTLRTAAFDAASAASDALSVNGSANYSGAYAASSLRSGGSSRPIEFTNHIEVHVSGTSEQIVAEVQTAISTALDNHLDNAQLVLNQGAIPDS